jgi:hypothetical protein
LVAGKGCAPQNDRSTLPAPRVKVPLGLLPLPKLNTEQPCDVPGCNLDT